MKRPSQGVWELKGLRIAKVSECNLSLCHAKHRLGTICKNHWSSSGGHDPVMRRPFKNSVADRRNCYLLK